MYIGLHLLKLTEDYAKDDRESYFCVVFLHDLPAIPGLLLLRTVKACEGMLCPVIERHLSFRTAIQTGKKDGKLSYFVQFENEMPAYHALSLNKAELRLLDSFTT